MKIVANEYSVGEVMKFIRQAEDMTQEEFGNAISRSKNTIKDYEKNKIKYSFELLLKFAKKYNYRITIEKMK
ncbi:MAG: helix-turn-helix transcriptional regulator [Firmicutes bacterium]|nr:helix-turn-helix transcriptional regulator [Bacillota bacterium]